MTNIYITVERDGEKRSRLIEDCTKAEIADYFDELPPEKLRAYAMLLAGFAAGTQDLIAALQDTLLQIGKLVKESPLDNPKARAEWNAMDMVHRVAWLEVFATAHRPEPKDRTYV